MVAKKLFSEGFFCFRTFASIPVLDKFFIQFIWSGTETWPESISAVPFSLWSIPSLPAVKLRTLLL